MGNSNGSKAPPKKDKGAVDMSVIHKDYTPAF